VSESSGKLLRVLIVEDSEFDARVLVNMLRRGGYEPEWRRIDSPEAFEAALRERQWQLILADYNLPRFSAPAALETLQKSGFDIPFIVISGGIGEDIAVAMMKAGANDYLMKGSLARLVPAVQRELRDAEIRAARRQAEADLRESELRYRQIWESATDAVMLLDSGLKISFANRASETVFGFTVGELTGKAFSLLQLATPGGDSPKPLSDDRVFNLAASRRSAVELSGARRSGEEVLLEGAFNEIEMSGERWIVCFLRDVTEKMRNEAELRRRREQFEIAREIQQRLFPKQSPKVNGLDIAGVSVPAEEAGGDYFDFLPMMHGRIGVVVGDVAGHGVGPALLMAEARAYLRLLVLNRDDVGQILTRANLALVGDVDFEHYVTMILAEFDPVQRLLRFASAGHTAAYVLGTDGAVRLELKRSGMALGLRASTEYQTQPAIALSEGEIVLLLTDGVEEAASPDGDLFGRDRLLEVVKLSRDRDAAHILNAVREAVRAFSGNQPPQDDITLVVVKVAATA
jgi:PAS domain S-box-containing protein